MIEVEEIVVERFYQRWRTELGYSLITLAQIVIMIAVWMAYRPGTFDGLPGGPPMAIAIVYLVAGLVGLYSGFKALSFTAIE